MSNEAVKRLELVRQYLLDVFHNPNSILEATDAVNYVKFNFHEAVRIERVQDDLKRQITRVGVGSVALAELPTFHLDSGMVEVRVGQLWPLISSEQSFASWFQRRLMSPIIAEEGRILSHSLKNIIHTGSGIGSYFDRSAETFRFKVWEVVHFPEAKDVPPRVLPSPDQLNPPSRRLE